MHTDSMKALRSFIVGLFISVVDRAALANYNYFNLSGILHFALNAMGDIVRKDNRASFVNHFG